MRWFPSRRDDARGNLGGGRRGQERELGIGGKALTTGDVKAMRTVVDRPPEEQSLKAIAHVNTSTAQRRPDWRSFDLQTESCQKPRLGYFVRMQLTRPSGGPENRPITPSRVNAPDAIYFETRGGDQISEAS